MNPVFVEGFPSHARLGRARRAERQTAPGATSANGTLVSAVREAADALGVANVGVWAFDGEEHGLRLVTRLGRDTGVVERDEHYGAELGASFGRALRGVTSLTIEDAERLAGRAEPLRAWLEAEGIRAILAMPVRTGDRLEGFVSLEHTAGPHTWTSRDRDVAGWLALQAGASLAEDLRNAGNASSEEEAQGREFVSTRGAERPHALPVPPAAEAGRRIRRLSRMEGASAVHAEEAFRLLEALEVQDGYLRMLEDALSDRAGDVELLDAARQAGDVVRSGLRRFLRFVAEGARSAPVLDLNRLLPDMIEAMVREVGDGGRLRIAPSSGALPVAADAALLERALVHLVRNAREASPGDAVIRVSWAPVVRESRDGTEWEGVRVRVEDTGEGIPAHDFPWLFEPFFSSRGDEHPLRGLGLPIVQAIVEAHGGWVEARSREGEGTEVDLYLPLVLTRAHGAVQPAGGAGKPKDATSWRRRILLLEADPLLAGLIDRILSRAGYQVERFSTPAEAERRLRADTPPVDLLVVSWDLAAGLSGVEFAESWRARRPGLPAILLRAGSPPASVGIEPGIRWIAPPFDPREIERTVDDLLDDGREVDTVDASSGMPH